MGRPKFKISPNIKNIMKEMYRDGRSINQIAEFFDVSKTTVKVVVCLPKKEKVLICPIYEDVKRWKKHKDKVCGFYPLCENEFKGKYEFCGGKK